MITYLDDEPLGRLGLVQQDDEQIHNLPHHLEGPCNDERERLAQAAKRRLEGMNLNIATVEEGRKQGRLFEMVSMQSPLT